MEQQKCPNGCGELEYTYGTMDNDECIFKIIILWCPECGYIYEAEARF